MKRFLLALMAAGLMTVGFGVDNTAEARGRVVIRGGPRGVRGYYRGGSYYRGYPRYRGYYGGYNRAPRYYGGYGYGYPGYRGYGYGYGYPYRGSGIYFRF